MKLYHYSVDSYKSGPSLTNDYKNSYSYAEPYILALREGMDVFKSTFYATMYMSRELVALKLRKYENYIKDTVEAIFEYVRETEFPNETSRLRCVYYCHTEEEAVQYAMDDCISSGLFTKEQVKLLEVEVEATRVREYDQRYYNIAMNSIEDNDFNTAFQCARDYFSLKRTEEPLIEVVCDGNNRILRELAFPENQ